MMRCQFGWLLVRWDFTHPHPNASSLLRVGKAEGRTGTQSALEADRVWEAEGLLSASRTTHCPNI